MLACTAPLPESTVLRTLQSMSWRRYAIGGKDIFYSSSRLESSIALTPEGPP